MLMLKAGKNPVSCARFFWTVLAVVLLLGMVVCKIKNADPERALTKTEFFTDSKPQKILLLYDMGSKPKRMTFTCTLGRLGNVFLIYYEDNEGKVVDGYEFQFYDDGRIASLWKWEKPDRVSMKFWSPNGPLFASGCFVKDGKTFLPDGKHEVWLHGTNTKIEEYDYQRGVLLRQHQWEIPIGEENDHEVK